jgi:hypothetical protein
VDVRLGHAALAVALLIAMKPLMYPAADQATTALPPDTVTLTKTILK